MTFVDVIALIVLFIIYVVLGNLIGATMFKRSSASWRSWQSNLGEFIMSFGLVGLITYSFFWPGWMLTLGLSWVISKLKGFRHG
jgi:hypothetical protein